MRSVAIGFINQNSPLRPLYGLLRRFDKTITLNCCKQEALNGVLVHKDVGFAPGWCGSRRWRFFRAIPSHFPAIPGLPDAIDTVLPFSFVNSGSKVGWNNGTLTNANGAFYISLGRTPGLRLPTKTKGCKPAPFFTPARQA